MAAAGQDIDLDKLMASGQVIKDDIATTVVRTMWSGRDVVIKRYNYRGLARTLANIVRGSRAKRAWRNGQLLKRIGVATPEPLAFFETKRYGFVRESFLITPYIEGTNFHHYIRNENLPADLRRRVVEQIKSIFDTLTRHKISHGDTKPSNFLVADDGPVITDLDSMKIRRSAAMAKRRSERDLVRFVTRINTDDISVEMKRLCASACGYNGPLPYHFMNNYFEMPAARNNGWNIIIRRKFNPQDATAIIEGGICRDANRYIRHNSSKMARLWTATAGYRGRDIRIFIKEHLRRSVGDFVKNLFRDGRAKRAFKASLMLRKNGFDCPEPLVLLEKRFSPFNTEGILVTESIPDCLQLHTYLQRLATEGTYQPELEKRDIISKLGDYVGKMHKLGIFHGDLRTGNILLQNDNGQRRFYLVDNERTQQFAKVPHRLIIKNLVQLNMFRVSISNTDRMRFLKTYNRHVKLTDEKIRRLCNLVIKTTRKRLVIREIHHST